AGGRAKPNNGQVSFSQAMEKLYAGGHEEIQCYLLRNIPKLREEVEIIRTITKSKIGYDAFKPKIVEEYARKAFAGWIDEDMIVRRSKIIHVALFNLLNQGAADRKRAQEVDRLKKRLENAWEAG